ncbi:glycyl-tRNA synthetase beta chain [Granulicella aggregans]|uniref:Glycine--tRNA ligase beta subunit n=1 Tax=Granulicella aggregans TaxID=474949 RepID=A0A7W8E1U7_9BACT|nr:glycine--tRNA ligase subunit beta [Granulicella aggregans]MBB5055651.1 glycyl-tRNA synthetase beta chain [Granulicella aggregans]
MSEFLFEIGLEEVPARMIASAEAELARRVTTLLERERLIIAGAEVKSYSTPRRLAVLVSGVAAKQEDLAEEMLGPSAKIAYKDGVATPAAVAFAKKAGVTVEALKTVETPKGEYLAATSLKPGRTAAEVIAEALPKELAGIYWAKNMYWRPGKSERFVRPVRWMVALLDDAIVPVEFAGYTASNATYGHRVLAGPNAITLAQPVEYAATLEKAFVLADVEARRHKIRKALDHVCRTLPNTRWREDHELVDKMTHLTEWPSVIAGGFEVEYLTLPEEVLVTVMRDHQNYFAVESADCKLAPHFLAVLNTVAKPEGEAVIRHGNERVLRARFNDARFFWEFDQRVPLLERVELLKKVTFQKELGSYAAKSERVSELCKRLANLVIQRLMDLEYNALLDAASLAKTDLTSELVKEFTELQGIVGGLYARAQRFSPVTADAIYDHYLPTSMDSPIPRTVEGQILALADKADTIAGMFSLGLEPTGSKDPFALRRAANGIVKILAESKLPLTLSEIALCSASDAVKPRIIAFFAERVDFYLREARGQAYDVVKAVLAVGGDDVRDAIARAEAVTGARSSADFAAISAAFKRMKNILAQASEVKMQDVDLALLNAPEEKALAERSAVVAASVEALQDERRYDESLVEIASLRPQVDAFFDAVMVMAPEPEIRANRLALLARITGDFSRIADFSEIVVAG